MKQSLRNNLLKTNENAKGIVLSNSPNVVQKGAVLYLPIYFYAVPLKWSNFTTLHSIHKSSLDFVEDYHA